MKHPFVWAELRSDNVEQAKKFYAELFGWHLEDAPTDDKSVYVLVKGTGAGKEFGAGMMANPAKGHMGSHWTPFIQVDDVASYSEKAASLGGTVVQKSMKTPWGIISTVLDPTGAAFSLWQENASTL